MRRLFTWCVALLPLLAGAAASTPDPLANLRPGHPRLLFNDEQLAAALTAAKTDSLRAILHAHLLVIAEAQLKEPPIEHKLVGPRMLDQSRKAIAQILTGAMAFRLSGDRRFADHAKQTMLTAAAFADWNPSHFLDVAEMSCALGLGYDWLYSQLSPTERATIKRALLEKSLSFAATAYQPGSTPDKRLWFATAPHNWNQVCNGGLLTAALALADEEPALARLVIAGVRQSLPLAMAAYQPDGAYPEGPGYWDYGTTYNVITLALLEGTLGTDFGLGNSLGFDRSALYRLYIQSPTGLSFNYADGGDKIGPSPQFTWLGLRYHQPAALAQNRALLAAAFDKNFSRESDRFAALNVVWFPVLDAGVPEEVEGVPLDAKFYGPAQLAIFRSSWTDPLALWVGFKAGSNTVNHAHLDLGSFILDSDGERWGIDLGPDDYNLPDYFGAKRWSYFRVNNNSHNTLSFGKALQNPKATAPIISFGSTPHRAFAIADLTEAYPSAGRKLLRGIAVLDRSRVLVQDEVSGAPSGSTFYWRMFTQANFQVTGAHHVRLEQHGRGFHAEILEPEGAFFAIRPAVPPTPAEKQNQGAVALVAEWKTKRPDERLVILLTPTGSHWHPALPPPVTPLSQWSTVGVGP